MGLRGFVLFVFFFFFEPGYPLSPFSDSDNDEEDNDLIYLTNWLFRKGTGGKCVKNSVKKNERFKIQ